MTLEGNTSSSNITKVINIGHFRTIHHVSNCLSRLTFYFIQYYKKYKREEASIEDINGKNGKLTLRKAECAEQEAALDKLAPGPVGLPQGIFDQ